MITVCLKVELSAESFNKTHVKEEVNMSEHVGDVIEESQTATC